MGKLLCIACFLSMNDDNFIIVTLRNSYRSPWLCHRGFIDKMLKEKKQGITEAAYKNNFKNFCLHDQKKIIGIRNFLSMFSCMYVNS